MTSIEALDAICEEARGLALPEDRVSIAGPGAPRNGSRAGGVFCVAEGAG